MSGRRKGGYDNFNPFVEIKEPPASLVTLRNLLQRPENADILEAASKAKDFEDALGIIALQLDILLDGLYEVDQLCEVLNNSLSARGLHSTSPHKRDSRLVAAELVEREGTVTIETVKDDK